MPASASPDTNRVTMSTVKSGEKALASAVTPYAASDHRQTERRPIRSDTGPHTRLPGIMPSATADRAQPIADSSIPKASPRSPDTYTSASCSHDSITKAMKRAAAARMCARPKGMLSNHAPTGRSAATAPPGTAPGSASLMVLIGCPSGLTRLRPPESGVAAP